MENPYFERIAQVWDHLTPWQQKKLFIKAVYWAMLDKLFASRFSIRNMMSAIFAKR